MTNKEFLFCLSMCIGLIAYVFYQSRDYEFIPIIAECRKMNDVTMILEGRLHNKNKKITGLSKRRLAYYNRGRVAPLPKPIYVFKSTHVYKGISVNGLHHTRFSYVIREGETAHDALGKKALICFKGRRPLTIKAIYIAD